LTRRAFLELRSFVIEKFEAAQDVWVHDWLIYAFFRAKGFTWYIDGWPSVRYRQHSSNEIGANFGWRAAAQRFRQVRSGEYRRNIILIARLVNDTSFVADALERLRWFDRMKLILNVWQMRRRVIESAVLAVFVLVMRRD
jgi:rhamnosyltransferase